MNWEDRYRILEAEEGWMNKGTGEYKDEVWGQQQVETCVVATHLGEFQRTTTRIYTIIDVNYNNYYHMVVFLFSLSLLMVQWAAHSAYKI